MSVVVLLVTALAVGALIGAVGVGGVLLAPVLLLVGGLGPHEAAATALCCVVPASIAAAVQHRTAARRSGSLERRLAGGLVLGAVAGALLNGALPATVLTVVLGTVAGLSGLWLLLRPALAGARRRETLSPGAGALLGAVVGGGSALSGTSGPVLLVPALVAWRVPARRAVAVGQAAQAVVAPTGAIAYLSTTELDYQLVAVLSVAVLIGQLAGRRVTLAERSLRTVVAIVLLGTSAVMALSAFPAAEGVEKVAPGLVRQGVLR